MSVFEGIERDPRLPGINLYIAEYQGSTRFANANNLNAWIESDVCYFVEDCE